MSRDEERRDRTSGGDPDVPTPLPNPLPPILTVGLFPIPWQLPPRAKTVAIFGAGVAGLTAAHELVERGYGVEVYESAPPSPLEDECSLGGMARTQWSRGDRVGLPVYKDPRAFVPTQRLDWRLDEALKYRIRFEPRSATELTKQDDEEDRAGEATFDQLIAAIKATTGDYSGVRFEVRGFSHLIEPAPATSPWEPPNPRCRLDVLRAIWIRSEIVRRLNVVPVKDFKGQFVVVGWGLGRAEEFAVARRARDYVEIRAQYDYIPGEHGYRFFPTFYRNLRNTLKRIPVPEDREPFVETSRTVFDNLVQTTSQGVSFENKPPYVLPRRRLLSAQEFFDLLVVALDGSKFTLDDTNRLAVKTFKFMTSCRERRKQYEKISWWDFIGGDDFSEPFQRYVQQVAQAFVAMTVKECDARTYGDVSIQLYRDQFLVGERIDAVLNGPTSISWFYPWRRYLESQGVRFIRGKLVDFHVRGDLVWPKVVLRDDIEAYESNPAAGRVHFVHASYYVLALNIEAIHALLTTGGGASLHRPDFDRIRKLQLGLATDEKPDGVLHHLVGLQFYFQSEFKQVLGHTVYPDAVWGLSSVYQPQFWLRKLGWWDGYRGVLSVCIGKWHMDPTGNQAAPWNSTARHIAHRVWQQIKRTVPKRERKHLPTPVLYHIDDNLLFALRHGDPAPKPAENLSRMFINLPGTQSLRPGMLWRRSVTEGDPPRRRNAYRIWYDKFVFAGTYMRTFTRLTTMEAANESARHAVNGILNDDRFGGDRCAIEDPEDYELPDLEYFKDLDAELMKEGLPHFVDILNLRKLTSEVLRGELNLGSLFTAGALK